MRGLVIVGNCLVLIATGSSAWAQAKKPPERPPAETVRYFQFTDLMGELPVDASLKEVRQGPKLISAVLDVCHSVSVDSPRKDRFVVNLKVEGDKLTGNAQSQEERAPVAVSLTRKRTDKTFSFSGTIIRGGKTFQVESTDNEDVSESEFRDSQPAAEPIADMPETFTEVSPGAVAAKIKREALLDLIKQLKSENVAVDLASLTADCADLREGEQIIGLTVAPERAPALVHKLKGLPGVTAAGWESGTYTLDTAVRIPASAWTAGDGKIDRAKLADEVGSAAAKSVGATLVSTDWIEKNGELIVKLKRANDAVPQLSLTDNIDLSWLLSNEGPEKKDALIVWLGKVTVRTADEGPEPRLQLSQEDKGEEQGDAGPNRADIVSAVAQSLHGQLWDSDLTAWK